MKQEKDILFTRKFYPKQASQGWLFYVFRYRADDNTLSNKSIIEDMRDWQATEISHSRETTAYLDTGECRDDLYPIFVKINKKEILEQLGALRYILVYTGINRWNILDI